MKKVLLVSLMFVLPIFSLAQEEIRDIDEEIIEPMPQVMDLWAI